MTIAIIGPTSYIGEHLSSSFEGLQKEYRLISLRKRRDVKYEFPREVYFLEELTEAMVREMGITSVIICTSLLASECEVSPQRAAMVNTRLVLMAVDFFQRAGVKRFLYLSTIKVYGEDLGGDVTEKTAVSPKTIYSKTHYDTELALRSVGSNRGLEVLILRLSNVFGAPIRNKESAWALATNCFAQQMATTGSIDVKSPGVFRNILPIRSLTTFIGLWVEEGFRSERFEIVNIGSSMTLSMCQIAQLVKDVFCGDLDSSEKEPITPRSEGGFRYSVVKMLKLMGKSDKETDRDVLAELRSLCDISKRTFG